MHAWKKVHGGCLRCVSMCDVRCVCAYLYAGCIITFVVKILPFSMNNREKNSKIQTVIQIMTKKKEEKKGKNNRKFCFEIQTGRYIPPFLCWVYHLRCRCQHRRVLFFLRVRGIYHWRLVIRVFACQIKVVFFLLFAHKAQKKKKKSKEEKKKHKTR